jgi:preprotein translocase subunit SecE
VAERKRRGGDADGGSADDEVRDSLDEAAAEETLEDDIAGESDSDDEGSASDEDTASSGTKRSTRAKAAGKRDGKSSGTTAVRSKSSKAGTGKSGDKKNDKSKKDKTDGRPRGLGRLTRFVREVVAELRKVIWPTRKELVTYAVVVIIFVAVILAIVGLLDLGFSKAALWVFGGGKNNQ